MDRNNVLKFQVAIEDKASDGLKEIESRLNGIVEKFKSSVGGINAELGKIGQSVQMPNMAEAIRQTEKLKDSLKKNTDDIPLFKNVLEQMQQLQNFIGKNTLGGELDRMKKSLSSVFAEIPKVDNNSFTVYFNQLNKAYSEFMAKFGTQRTRTPNLLSIGESMQKMGGLAGGDTLLREYQAQAEQIKATIINTVRETNEVISATRFLIKDSAKDFGKIDSNINKVADSLTRLSEAFTRFNGTVGGDQNLKNMMAGMGEIIRNVKFSMSSLKEGQENLNWGKTMADNAKSVIQARVEMERLVPLVEKLKTQQLLSKGLGLDTSNIDVTIQRVQHLQQLLMSITAHGGFTSTGVENLNGLNASQLMSAYKEHLVKARNDLASQSQANAQALKSEAQAQKENALAKSHAAQANQQLSSEEGRLAQAIQQATNSAHGQSQVISDLKSMALQYLSVWGAQQFVTDMANITGELELQKKSLEVILDSGTAATEMYNQIRDLSQQSPYTFEDLLKSHRQLAAFGIEAKDIFGTMKALSDIGAGLDVEISRLILAYGHTRSYGYLSGIQNRQFENAGIDMIGGLTKLYNDLADAEERAGRSAEHVTRKDIFSRMRSRDIPFKDVEKVILDLDREGGKFYNMQERQFETLGGKLRNLRNNYRIMMSEMGQANHGLLTFGVGIINNLTENWSKYSMILTDILVPIGAVKLGMLALNSIMGDQTKAVEAMIAANRRMAAENRMVAVANNPAMNGAGLWSYIKSGFSSINKFEPISFGDNGMFSSRGVRAIHKQFSSLNKTQLLQMSLNKRLPEQYRRIAASMAGLNMQQAAYNSHLSGSRRRLRLFGLGLQRAGVSIRAFAASMWTAIVNPATAAMAVVSGIVALFTWIRKEAATVANVSETIASNARRDLEGITKMLDEYQNKFLVNFSEEKNKRNSSGTTKEGGGDVGGVNYELPVINRDGTNYIIDQARIQAEGVENIFEELEKKMQTASPLYKADLFDMQKVDDEVNKVAMAIQKLSDIEYAKQIAKDNPGVMASANGDTHNFLTDSYMEDVKDLQKRRQDANAKFLKVDVDEIREFFKNHKEDLLELKRIYGENIADVGNERKLLETFTKRHDAQGLTNLIAGMDEETIKSYFDAKAAIGNAESELEPEIKEIANTVANMFEKEFKDRPAAFKYYLRDQLDALAGEFKIGDPDAIEEQFFAIFKAVSERVGGGELGEEFKEMIANSMMGPEVEAEIEKNLNGRKLSDLTKPELDRLVDLSVNNVKKRLQEKFPLLKDVIAKLFSLNSPEVGKALNGVRETMHDYREIWKREAYGKLGSTLFGPLIAKAETYVDMVDAIRKKHKELAHEMSILKPTLEMQIGFKIGASSKAFREKILNVYGVDLAKSGSKYSVLKSVRDNLVDIDNLKRLYQILVAMEDAGDYSKGKGFSLDDGKGGKGGKGRSRGGGTYHDEFSKRWDERIRIMKEAYDWYDKWEKRVGNASAIDKVNEKYGDIFKEWKTDKVVPLDFDVKRIKDYEIYIEKIRDEALKRYNSQKNNKSKNNGQESLRVYRQAVSLLSEIESDRFDRASEKWASKTSLWLDRLTKKWEVYNKVLKETGDKQLAVSLSGFNAEKYQNVADAAREKIAADLKEAGVKSSYDFNVDASDTEIEDSVKAMFGKDTSEEKIKSIVGELKKWRELQKQINDESVETYSNLIGGISRFADAVRKANSEHEKTIESLRKALEIGKITKVQYEQAEAIATAKRDIKTNEASYGYRNLMRGSVSIPAKEIKTNADMAIRRLDDALGSGAITADEYADKITKIDDALRKITDKKNISAFSVFLKGGWQGVLDHRREEEVDRLSVYTQEAEQAVKKRDEAKLVLEKSPNDAALQFAYERARMDVDAAVDKVRRQNKKVQENDKHSAAYKKLSKTVNEAVEALGKFSQALDFLGDFFDSLGMAGAANAVADVQTMANGALRGASSLSFLGPEGMIAGGALGLIGGIFQARDNGIERRIEALRGEVSKIEGYTELIARGRERTLGYDRGEVLRAYQRQYAANMSQIRLMGMVFSINKEGAAGKAMSDYYSSAGGKDTNGYQQELSLLTQKRKDYIDMYNEENKKKKKSKESMEEYKKKIAELDDQIAHFSEDLAKNLWGIDLKSWADQIGDALANAFENGENAANAYKNAVNNIMRSVVNQVLKIGIIQPMMEKLQHKLLGYTDEKGNYHAGIVNTKDPHAFDNPNEIAAKMLSYTADFMSDKGEGKNFMVAVTEFLNGYEKMLNDAGFSIKNNNSKTLSSGIQGTTEETSDLLAGYINALRQDVSYIRLMQTQFINEAWPDYMKQITGMATALGNINSNVAAIRSIISENGALYQKVEMLSDDLHNVIFGSQRLHIA